MGHVASKLGEWWGELTDGSVKKWSSLLPQYALDAHGRVLRGWDIDVYGDQSGSYTYPINLMNALDSSVLAANGHSPNPFEYAYSYKGGRISTENVEYRRIIDLYGDPYFNPVNTATDINFDDLETMMTSFGTWITSNALDIEAVDIDHDRAYNQISARAYALNYHGSSAYATMVGKRASEVALRKAAIRQNNQAIFFNGMVPVLNTLVQAQVAEAELLQKQAFFNAELKLRQVAGIHQTEKEHFIAQSDAWQADAVYNESEARWNWDRIYESASLLNPLGAQTLSPPQPTKGQLALSAALSVGANTAMGIGSQFGNPVLGAIVGIAAGGAAGLMQLR